MHIIESINWRLSPSSWQATPNTSAYWRRCWTKLRPDALIAADNINLADTKPYLEYFRAYPKLV
jgi:predicted O-methyltransferase YrrM